MSPALTIADQRDSPCADTGNYRQSVRWDALPKQASNVDHLFSGEFCLAMFLTDAGSQTRAPLVLCVLGKAYPFEIARCVVGFVSVDVIDRQIGFVAFTEGECNESVQRLLYALAMAHRCNFRVPTTPDANSKFPGSKRRGELLLLPVSHTDISGRMRTDSNATET